MTTSHHQFDFHGHALDEIFGEYREMREVCPVAHSDRYGGFWAVTRYEDIFMAEKDWETFAVSPTMLLPAFGTDRPMIPIDVDPPAHTAYRRLLLPFFTPARIDELVESTRKVAQDLLVKVRDDQIFDASALYARPVPTLVFSMYAGFPTEDAPRFDRWVDEIIYERQDDDTVSRRAAGEVYDYFRNLIRQRRYGERGTDIVSVLIDSEIYGRPLTDDELLDICNLLFLAGLDTTAWAIRSSLWHLAQSKDDRERLAAEPALIPSAAEEYLRTLSPVQAMARTVTHDTVIGGTPIRAGERVALVFGSGNRDPSKFGDPDTVRIDREDNPHIAFGLGIHRCLGSNLARREIMIALEEFLAAIPDFHLAEPAPWHGVGPLMIERQ
jgi:cytochrome P450